MAAGDTGQPGSAGWASGFDAPRDRPPQAPSREPRPTRLQCVGAFCRTSGRVEVYWMRSATSGAGTAQMFPVKSRIDLVARMPRPNLPSIVRASLFQPWSTHLLSTGTVSPEPADEGTVTGPRSTSLSLAVRT